jgi:hypothetical protein
MTKLTGYGLYADNVYLRGGLITEFIYDDTDES